MDQTDAENFDLPFEPTADLAIETALHNPLILVDTAKQEALVGVSLFNDGTAITASIESLGQIPINPDWPEGLILIDGTTFEHVHTITE